MKRIVLTLANLVWGGKVKFAHVEQVRAFENSGVFATTSEIDIHWVYRQWANSERIWNLGFYHQSVEIKRQVMEHIYQKDGSSCTNQVAPVMSIGWAVAIGHLGSLGAFILGQRSGIIPSEKRWITVSNVENFSQINKLVQDEIRPVLKRADHSILEHASQWGISERLQMINTNFGFLSLYEMHERVYRGISKNHKLQLSNSYIEVSKQKLHELGLPADAWFVGFHIRENRLAEDSRVATIENFYPAIKKITREGGWVVRFGTGTMRHLPKMPNVIDLHADTTEIRSLHMFILSQCRFLLTTNSGPSVLAWCLGTAVLQTNTLSVGRNILSASHGSLYLPKKYQSISGHNLSFHEILSSPEAYAETNLKQKFMNGFRLQENSPDEILLATEEMLYPANNEARFQAWDSKVNKIRHEVGAVGYGRLAPSFLVENEDWFLR